MCKSIIEITKLVLPFVQVAFAAFPPSSWLKPCMFVTWCCRFAGCGSS